MTRYPDRQFQIVLPFNSGWKSGEWFKGTEDILMFQLEDYYDESELPKDCNQQFFGSFIVYVRACSPLAGGCTKNNRNDCLYQCLWKAYGTRCHLPKFIKSPSDLKAFLGLSRSDLVPISLIPKLEKTIAINVIEDTIYHSKSKSHRKITLCLTNGHYSIVKNPKRKNLQIWSKDPKSPLIFHADTVNNLVKFYDVRANPKTQTGTVQDLTELKSHRWSGSSCLVSVEKKKDGKIETLEEAFYRFNTEAKTLLEETEKEYLPVDLKLCGGSYKIAALWLFSKLSQGVQENEPLDLLEAKWISDAMKGGLIWAEKDWEGHAKQYDVTSMYPYLMRKMTWPICKGKFQTIKDFEYNNKGVKMTYYGIFKAIVEEKDLMKKLFRYNKNGIYTHLDLTRAKTLGLKVTLQESSPNALIYNSQSKCLGEIMFGAYVDLLFKIKNTNGSASRPAKRILNTLWGALCQRKHSYTFIGEGTKYTSDLFEVPTGHMIKTIIPLDKDKWMVKYHTPEDIFQGEYPRVAPFLLELGHKTILEIIEPYTDRLKRVHTDGFILENEDQSLYLPVKSNATTTLGALKFEKEGFCQVKNAMQLIWH